MFHKLIALPPAQCAGELLHLLFLGFQFPSDLFDILDRSCEDQYRTRLIGELQGLSSDIFTPILTGTAAWHVF